MHLKLLQAGAIALLLAFTGLAQAQQVLRLSTTTSTENSGLLRFLLPAFEQESGIRVHVIAVGSGKALELARNGDVDVTLVHAREAEDQFLREGYGVARHDVMYNDYLVVGPASDPAGIRGMKDVISAFRAIIERKARFVSRGDKSGTDQMEQSYWKEIGAKPAGSAYVSAGLGMGEVLNMAAELRAYTLADRATYLAYRARHRLSIAVEGDPRMFNPYGIIAVNPARHKHVNYTGASKLIAWITSPAGQKRIAEFRIEGTQVFFPSAQVR